MTKFEVLQANVDGIKDLINSYISNYSGSMTRSEKSIFRILSCGLGCLSAEGYTKSFHIIHHPDVSYEIEAFVFNDHPHVSFSEANSILDYLNQNKFKFDLKNPVRFPHDTELSIITERVPIKEIYWYFGHNNLNANCRLILVHELRVIK